MSTLFYEQGTGKIGDADKLVLLAAPPFEIEHLYTSADTAWEYMNESDKTGGTVSVEDIIETLRAARDRSGDYLAGIEHILAVLDPGDSIDFEPEEHDLGYGYLDGARE